MTTPTIFLDESGNTGSNLLDNNQPVFTLVSCNFSEIEATALLSLVQSSSPHELHFKNLKRRKAGQDGIIRLLKSELINTNKVKATFFHKKYMLTIKLVEALFEEWFYINGFDLYKNGKNIALVNLLYNCLPAFYSEQLVEKMYENFIKMISDHSEENIEKFYQSVSNLNKSKIPANLEQALDILTATKDCIADILRDTDKYLFDPSMPALFSHCLIWGDEYPSGFHVIHDDSNTLEKEKTMLLKFMDWTKKTLELGYDRRKIKLPLKAKSLIFASSQSYPQIQVADILVGALTYWINQYENTSDNDYFFTELNKLDLETLIVLPYSLVPSTALTPEELDTIYDGGLHPINYISSSQ